MSDSYSFDQDLREAEAMVKSLVPYIHQEPLYGSVGGLGFFMSGSMPSLTTGSLLMRIRRLNALRDQLDADQQQRLEVIEMRNADVYSEWQSHYDKKLVREVHSRLDAMQTFFEECAANPRTCAQNYRPEASRRTIVQEVLIAMENLNVPVEEDLQNKLRAVDSRLRRFVQPDDFLWSETLKPAYDEGTFWWLYQRPPLPE
ncbi:MAG: hypothetical protein OHK0046_44590 [Anaerolineae bacterium]